MRRRDRRARAPSPARGAPPRTLVPPPPPHPARGPARLALAPPFPAPGSPRHPRDAPPPPPPRAGVPGRVSPPSFPIRAPIRRGPLRKRRSPPPARSPGPPGPHPQRSPPLGAPASALPSLPSLSTGSGPHFPPTRLPAAGKPVEVMGVQGVGERGARVLGSAKLVWIRQEFSPDAGARELIHQKAVHGLSEGDKGGKFLRLIPTLAIRDARFIPLRSNSVLWDPTALQVPLRVLYTAYTAFHSVLAAHEVRPLYHKMAAVCWGSTPDPSCLDFSHTWKYHQ
ncbi:uncharacterized protein LOC144341021 [Macaca mulatta]